MMSNRQPNPTTSRFPQGKRRWDKSAPRAIRRTAQNGDAADGWELWIEHLTTRKTPVPPARLWQGCGNALAWAAADADADGDALRLLRGLPSQTEDGSGFRPQEAAAWMADSSGCRPDPRGALEAMGWVAALATEAASFEPELWWRLLDHLLGLTQDAAECSLDRDPLVHQLLGAELALTLRYAFPEIAACRKLARQGRKALTAGLLELLDGGGLPSARVIEVFRPLLGCWTRCRLIGEHLPQGWASRQAQLQYAWAIRAAVRLSRPDGSGVFSSADGWPGDQGLFDAALRSAGDADDERIAAIALPGRKPPKHLDEDLLPPSADHSAWAAVTVLRPGWRRRQPRLVAAYPEREFRLELSQQKELLLAGVWEPLVSVDGEPLEAVSAWQELCWVSDNDVDYLELGIELSGGVRLQRHLALARQDLFLLLADAVIDCPAAAIEYRGRLPLAAGAGFGQAEETWEGFLLKDRAAALVLPLGLPEWRAAAGPGSLRSLDGALLLNQQSRGRALFAPLFIDLKPGRMTREATWRRLTVAENRLVQPPEVAVGYRVACGKQQWMIYRSLAPAANRTLLGHNLITELLIARFARDGQVQSLIEIEG